MTGNKQISLIRRLACMLAISTRRAINGRTYRFDEDDLTRGTIALGDAGSGKTVALTAIAQTMIQDGWGGLVLSERDCDAEKFVQIAKLAGRLSDVTIIGEWKPGMGMLARNGGLLITTGIRGERGMEVQEAVLQGFADEIIETRTDKPVFAFIDEAFSITCPSGWDERCAVLVASKNSADASGYANKILLRTTNPESIAAASSLLHVSYEMAAWMLGRLRSGKNHAQAVIRTHSRGNDHGRFSYTTY